MTIAITGGTGFVGQAVLDEAARRGRAVRALTRREQKPREGVTWVRGDLAATDALQQLCDGSAAVLHIAGVVNAPDEASFHEGNVVGTQNVVEAARQTGTKRVIHVSSLAAREPSLSQYGHSKRLAEEVVQVSGLDWTIVRPPAIFGPRDTEMFELFRAAKWRFVPMPPPGRMSVIHVADLARLLLDLTQADAPDRIFEPDDGRPGGWSHTDFAKSVGAALGKAVYAPAMPAGLLSAAAKLDRALRGAKAKLTPDRARYMAHPDWVSDPDKHVPAELWQPQISTRDGLARTAAWYLEQEWL
ncbi:NAD-dependent epimerase/dehydratase family protein [Aurantiacibacter aquimixticola]|uniref:NAD-dependent epimerase/dehydratase family protein n=1 Tax=Aurantiacibacter aquimixticola TaxID=1958945 RepID=A0A419RT80_9SPHN|nr:NAD(P)H-binding protein [Aurantiacibacter aquimixticola]RJY08988.1 NAD-dependent epimerase/dehydratase family protein [Aurantiacibacter aquimixticola]